MTLMKRTEKYSRRRLVMTRQGISARYERRSTYGGWYVKNSVEVPWPWVRGV